MNSNSLVYCNADLCFVVLWAIDILKGAPLPILTCAVDVLQSEKSPKDFAEELVGEAVQYNGFNLIVADLCSMTMFYVTNRPKDDGMTIAEVSPGIHVLSNAKLDTPWPKVRYLIIYRLIYAYVCI